MITFDPESLGKRLAALERELAEPGFWDDQQSAAEASAEHARVARRLERYERLKSEYEDARELLSMDGDMAAEIASSLGPLRRELDRLQEDALFSGEYEGENAYGVLKAERGVHRLVRLSPFDQAHRRHTSFAQVIVSPLLSDDVDVEIDEADLRIDTYRASGAGGQHVNKTDSAVRITHVPTGIVVQCQNERSQSSNRQTALRILKSRLVELEQEKREAELAKERGAAQDIGFGSQIRSYVLHPYQLVKDHRTEYETGNTQAVLDGDLDGLIHEYLLAKAAGRVT